MAAVDPRAEVSVPMTKTLQLLKDWWWLATVVGGALVLWGSLPDRVKKVEAGQQVQEEKVSELREWAKETQGYLKGQQALNERLAAQQEPANAPQHPTWRWQEEGWCCNAWEHEDCWQEDAEGRNGWVPCP